MPEMSVNTLSTGSPPSLPLEMADYNASSLSKNVLLLTGKILSKMRFNTINRNSTAYPHAEVTSLFLLSDFPFGYQSSDCIAIRTV
jgi:hypothetical protein